MALYGQRRQKDTRSLYGKLEWEGDLERSRLGRGLPVIVVDTTVWVDFFNGVSTPEVGRLRRLLGESEILVGDLILCEVLQGFGDDSAVAEARQALYAFDQAPMVGREIARKAAENYRTLRRLGTTVRKTIDVLIATFCIEKGHRLLHSDRDFEPFKKHLGLKTA